MRSLRDGKPEVFVTDQEQKHKRNVTSHGTSDLLSHLDAGHTRIATFHQSALAISTDHPEYMPGSYARTEQQAASSSTPARISVSTRPKRRLDRHET